MMKKKMRGLLRLIFGRTVFVVLFLAVQLAILIGFTLRLQEYMPYFYGASKVLSLVILLYILNKRDNPEYKISWIVPVLIFPVFGVLFYLFVETQFPTRWMARRVAHLGKEIKPYLDQDQKVMEHLEQSDPSIARLSYYMKQWGGYPVYEHTSVTYFPLGEDKFAELKRQLSGAKQFIFMEYFIIEKGIMWDSILEILEQKVTEGVEVRVMYDGFCSLSMLPYHYPEELEKRGITCRMFSPVKPVLSTHQNNRDHRKIVVIDGHTAFTGGVNLGDEYINQKVRFGHWKDTAIMLKGEAVKSFTLMFLQNWNIAERKQEIYEKYVTPGEDRFPDSGSREGFVMPYGDSPLDHETVGKQVYIDILNRAETYVHMMTPYLILDQDMITALTYAAKRGVETIIIMPHIPDKIYAYLLARSYYEELLAAGVKIYEYTPGFVHAKVYVSDDREGEVGTINMDYRSFYLHFECAAYIYRNPVVHDMEKDFQETLKKCQNITIEDCRHYPGIKKFAGSVLRLFAPLM